MCFIRNSFGCWLCVLCWNSIFGPLDVCFFDWIHIALLAAGLKFAEAEGVFFWAQEKIEKLMENQGGWGGCGGRAGPGAAALRGGRRAAKGWDKWGNARRRTSSDRRRGGGGATRARGTSWDETCLKKQPRIGQKLLAVCAHDRRLH